MKKALLSLIILTTVAISLFSCNKGADSNEDTPAIFYEIDKNQYVPSDGIRYMISGMVNNGITVSDSYTNMLLNNICKPNGYLNNLIKSGAEIKNIVFVNEKQLSPLPEYGTIVSQYYLSSSRTSYKTMDGITEESSIDDIKDLNGYVPFTPLKNGTAYAAIYFDDKLVDLSEYEDDFQVLMDTAKQSNLSVAISEHLKENAYYPAGCSLLSVVNAPNLGDMYNEDIIEGSLLIAIAAQEACEMLADDDLKSFDIIIYEATKNSMDTYYYHYFYDDNWSIQKYYNQ